MDEEVKTTITSEITDKKQNVEKPWLFQKGQSGNPLGRPVGSKNFTTEVKEALKKIALSKDGKDITFEQKLVERILHKAIVEGNVKMITLIWNYLDGLPKQNLQVDGEVRVKTFMDYVYEYYQGERDNNKISEKSD